MAVVVDPGLGQSGMKFLFVICTPDALPDVTLPIYPGLAPALNYTVLCILVARLYILVIYSYEK